MQDPENFPDPPAYVPIWIPTNASSTTDTASGLVSDHSQDRIADLHKALLLIEDSKLNLISEQLIIDFVKLYTTSDAT